jgi:hypothetical protein
MSKDRHKRRKLRHKAVLLTATSIQQRIMQTDADIFSRYSNVLEVVRPFVTGEFPEDFLSQYDDQQIQLFRWVKVIKQGEVELSGELAKQMGGTLGIRIRRIPLTQEQYEELVGPNHTPPPDNLPLDHLPFHVLKTTDEGE